MAFHHFFAFLSHLSTFRNLCGSTIFNSQINYSLFDSDEDKINDIPRESIELPEMRGFAKAFIHSTTEEIIGLFVLTKKFIFNIIIKF